MSENNEQADDKAGEEIYEDVIDDEQIDNTGEIVITLEEIIANARAIKNPVYDHNFLKEFRLDDELREVEDKFYCILNKEKIGSETLYFNNDNNKVTRSFKGDSVETKSEMKVVTILAQLVDTVHYLADIAETLKKDTQNDLERHIIEYVNHETKMCKNYIKKYEILRENYSYLFEEENKKQVDEEDKHAPEEDEKVEESKSEGNLNYNNDSDKKLEKIKELCEYESKQMYDDFNERLKGLTIFGKPKFFYISRFLTCGDTTKKFNEKIDRKKELEKEVKKLDNKIYAALNILEKHNKESFDKADSNYQVIHHKLNREEQNKARDKNLYSFEEVKRQEEQINKNMDMLNADMQTQNEKYEKRLAKLYKNRENILKITRQIDGLITHELNAGDNELKIYSKEELGNFDRKLGYNEMVDILIRLDLVVDEKDNKINEYIREIDNLETSLENKTKLLSVTLKIHSQESGRDSSCMSSETIKLLKLLVEMTRYKGFSNKIQEIIIHDYPTYYDESAKDEFEPDRDAPNFQTFEHYVIDLIERITDDKKYKIKSLCIKGLRDHEHGNACGIDRDLLNNAIKKLVRSNIQRLDFSNIDFTTKDSLQTIDYFEKLKNKKYPITLRFNNCEIDKALFGKMIEIKSNSSKSLNFETLAITECKVSDNMLPSICDLVRIIPTIQQLNLSYNLLTKESFKALKDYVNGAEAMVTLLIHSNSFDLEDAREALGEFQNIRFN